ncbi:MAG: hypothetical protein NTY99_02375 [DPANN group archaeon]|nr:hypothetical protein [DPANN group archaeon]
MKRTTFVIVGLVSLIVVLSGFVASFLHQFIISLVLIAIGGASFWFAQKKAKKEDWFGKPVSKTK